MGPTQDQFVDKKKVPVWLRLCWEVGHLSYVMAARSKQMGDSGNWRQGLLHAVMALPPEKPHLPVVCWSVC